MFRHKGYHIFKSTLRFSCNLLFPQLICYLRQCHVLYINTFGIQCVVLWHSGSHDIEDCRRAKTNLLVQITPRLLLCSLYITEYFHLSIDTLSTFEFCINPVWWPRGIYAFVLMPYRINFLWTPTPITSPFSASWFILLMVVFVQFENGFNYQFLLIFTRFHSFLHLIAQF